MRAVAARAGVSVQAVYTLFGGKPGLCEALFDEGFAALQAALDAVAPALTPSEAPAEVVVRQVLTYRATALAALGTYAMMFGRPVPEFQPSPEALARARGSLLSLVTVLQRASPKVPTRPPSRRRSSCGAKPCLVSLELDGVIPGDGGRQLDAPCATFCAVGRPAGQGE